MTRLLPTLVRIGSCGPTGPRFCAKSSALAGGPATPRATKALAVANPRRPIRVSEDIVISFQASAQTMLSLMGSLAHLGKTRCGFCHNIHCDFCHTCKMCALRKQRAL